MKVCACWSEGITEEPKTSLPPPAGHHEALGVCETEATSFALWSQVPTCVCLSFAKYARPRPSGNQLDPKKNWLVGLEDTYLAPWSQVLGTGTTESSRSQGKGLVLQGNSERAPVPGHALEEEGS